MARLPIVDPANAPANVAPALEAVRKKLGLVPNITRVMANSPAVLEGYLGFSGALAGAKLSPRVREQIALFVAETNACTYCLSAHSAIGAKLGLSPNELEAARRGEAGDPRSQAALSFAARVLAMRGRVAESDVRTALDAGLSEAEVAEVVAVVALNVFTNYFNRAFAVDVDFPVVRPISGAAESRSA
jgi:uncharacterized peroxidase-related enzyme